jgi:hypothetical protein
MWVPTSRFNIPAPSVENYMDLHLHRHFKSHEFLCAEEQLYFSINRHCSTSTKTNIFFVILGVEQCESRPINPIKYGTNWFFRNVDYCLVHFKISVLSCRFPFFFAGSSSSCSVGFPNSFSFVTRKFVVISRKFLGCALTKREYVTRLREENESNVFHIKADIVSQISQEF